MFPAQALRHRQPARVLAERGRGPQSVIATQASRASGAPQSAGSPGGPPPSPARARAGGEEVGLRLRISYAGPSSRNRGLIEKTRCPALAMRRGGGEDGWSFPAASAFRNGPVVAVLDGRRDGPPRAVGEIGGEPVRAGLAGQSPGGPAGGSRQARPRAAPASKIGELPDPRGLDRRGLLSRLLQLFFEERSVVALPLDRSLCRSGRGFQLRQVLLGGEALRFELRVLSSEHAHPGEARGKGVAEERPCRLGHGNGGGGAFQQRGDRVQIGGGEALLLRRRGGRERLSTVHGLPGRFSCAPTGPSPRAPPSAPAGTEPETRGQRDTFGS